MRLKLIDDGAIAEHVRCAGRLRDLQRVSAILARWYNQKWGQIPVARTSLLRPRRSHPRYAENRPKWRQDSWEGWDG